MNLHTEETAYLQEFKTQLNKNKPFTRTDLFEFADKFEELVDMHHVSVKIIDRLKQNYDRLRLQSSM